MSNRVVNLILVGFIAVLCILLLFKSNRKPERDLKHEIELKNKYDSCQRVITSLKDSIESNKLVINNLNNLSHSARGQTLDVVVSLFKTLDSFLLELPHRTFRSV